MKGMRLALTTVFLALTSCESVDDVIGQQRAGVEQTFGRLASLAPKVPLEPTNVDVAGLAEPVRLGGAEGNALVVYAEDLSHPQEASPVRFRTLDSAPLLHCGALLRKGTYFNDAINRPMPSTVKGYLTTCAQARYALVVRQTGYQAPALSLETKQFSRGRYQGQILVFDLVSGELKGSFGFEATNDDRVSLLDADSDHLPRLLSNLESAVYVAVRAALKAHLP